MSKGPMCTEHEDLKMSGGRCDTMGRPLLGGQLLATVEHKATIIAQQDDDFIFGVGLPRKQ